jgi:hypothetical protein
MQEKKNKRLAILLIAMISVIVILAFVGRDDETFEVDKSLYKVADLKGIDRIVLKSARGTADLRFQGYRWKVNDSIDADRGLIEVLFATLQQAEPKRPVAESLKDSVSGAIRRNGVEVSLFAGDTKENSFFAGGNDAKTQAIFVTGDGAQSHVMIIPGYRVYVSGIFEVPAVGWREKLIFNFNWQNFSRLEARYKNPSGNFDVVMEKNMVSIPQVAEPDTAKLNTYLDQVSLLMAEEYIEPNRVTDSLSATTPVLELSIVDIANRAYRLSVFTSGNQFYGKTGEKNWFLLQENRIIPVLRPKEFFVRR